jgi:hypothetical protein
MASVTSLSRVESDNRLLKALGIVPGVLLLAGIGYVAKTLEHSINTYAKTHHWTFPNVEYVLWAIVMASSSRTHWQSPKSFSLGLPPTSSGSNLESCFLARALFSPTF